MHITLRSLAAAAALAAASSAMSAVTVGGFTFDDNAFADTLIDSGGSLISTGGSPAQVVTDKTPDTYLASRIPGAFVELGFTDNLVVNGNGADLVLFELGTPDTFRVSLTQGGPTVLYTTQSTGGTAAGGFGLNAIAIDLLDFGLAPGATLASLVIGVDIVNVGNNTSPSLALVGALNSAPVPGTVPEPGTFALAGLALLGLRLGTARGRRPAVAA